MSGAPSITTDLKTTLRSSINDDGCGDRSVDRCDPDNYRIAVFGNDKKSRWTNEKHDAYLDSLERSFIRELSHSMMSKVGQIHEGRGGYNCCTGAGGICSDPDQAIYPKEGQVKPEIIESRRDRAEEGRYLDVPSSLQHSPKPCHKSSPCSGNDFSEHSGQNF